MRRAIATPTGTPPAWAPAPRASWLILGPLILLAAASLAWGGYHAFADSADLLRRAEEVRLVLRGLDPYADPDMTYPPTAPAVFVPLVAPLAERPAALKGAWLALNVASLAWIVAALLRMGGAGGSTAVRWGLAATLAASKPARLAIGMGQYALLPMALVLGAFGAAGRRRGVLAGVLLGAALVKPTMVLPFLVVFAVRGRWRALGVAAGVQLAALLAVAGWLGVAPDVLMREWAARAASQNAAGLVDVPSVADRLWPGAAGAAGPIALGVLAAGSAWIVACRGASDLALIAFAGFVAAIMAYHRPYDLVLLFPALALLVEAARRARPGPGRWFHGAVAGGFAMLLIAPAHPSIIAESAYDALFIPAAYGVLVVVAARLRFEVRAAAAASVRAEEGPGADDRTRGRGCRPPYTRADQCDGAGRPATPAPDQLLRASS